MNSIKKRRAHTANSRLNTNTRYLMQVTPHAMLMHGLYVDCLRYIECGQQVR